MFNSILCRYNEIATKGNNRNMFENRLLQNMRFQCSCVEGLSFQKIRGRMFIQKPGHADFTEEEIELLKTQLSRTFGLDSFSPCLKCEPSMEAIKEKIRLAAPGLFEKYADGDAPVEFRIRARRSDKEFALDSKGIEIELATLVEELIGEKKVKINLTDPKISIGVEVRSETALVYYETFKAAGGLPVGSNSPVLALLSGGIDSPVACNMTMKRGCHVDFLTFHSFPYTPMESVEKVKRIATLVNRYQKRGILYACNISEIQKLIRDNCNERYRTVLYRRIMMRIATILCRKYHLDAIVTGESVGQVASQTVANLSVIDNATPYLIIRPLCGMDKNETIRRAEEIGTFETSIEPMTDSCTVFAPPSPILHSKLQDVQEEETRIPNLEDAIEQAVHQIEVFKDLSEIK